MAEKKVKQAQVDPEEQQAADISSNAPEAEATATETVTEVVAEDQSLKFERSRKIAKTLWQGLLGTAITVEHRTAKMFKRLVEKGARFQYHNQYVQAQTELKDGDIENPQTTEKVTTKLRAVDRMHSIEHSIENTLDKGRSNTLHWIGVPSRDDIGEINAQVKILTEKVNSLEEQLRQLAYAEGGNKENKTIIA